MTDQTARKRLLRTAHDPEREPDVRLSALVGVVLLHISNAADPDAAARALVAHTDPADAALTARLISHHYREQIPAAALAALRALRDHVEAAR